MEFAWSSDSNEFAVREAGSRVSPFLCVFCPKRWDEREGEIVGPTATSSQRARPAAGVGQTAQQRPAPLLPHAEQP